MRRRSRGVLVCAWGFAAVAFGLSRGGGGVPWRVGVAPRRGACTAMIIPTTKLASSSSSSTLEEAADESATKKTQSPPKKKEYVVVGAGASGMAFVDTLFAHATVPVRVTLVDKRPRPGGHWCDAYSFVTLHQPARNYGVESTELKAAHPEQLASRDEILSYYGRVLENWQNGGRDVEFVGGVAFDFDQNAFIKTTFDEDKDAVTVPVDAAVTVVDARYTENDIPVLVPPRFQIANAAKTRIVPPNALPNEEANHTHYCVLGGGKTGQDAMLYLRRELKIPVDRLAWVVPTGPWITARDPPAGRTQITCMEFLDAALIAHRDAGSPKDAADSSDFLQRGFERLEKEGRVYRLFDDEDDDDREDFSGAPSKFMDATLNKEEIAILRECAPRVLGQNRGRVQRIDDDGSLVFADDGPPVELPWADDDDDGDDDALSRTTFVHCTAGAFDFGATRAEPRRPVFSSEDAAPRRITVQEVFQFPGFCFNAAVVAWLECQQDLSSDDKNHRCELPFNNVPSDDDADHFVTTKESADDAPLGATAGVLGPLRDNHPLLVSLRNLRRWYATPGMGDWLHSLRLFSLTMNGYALDEGRALADRNRDGLVAMGIMEPSPSRSLPQDGGGAAP